MIQTSAIGRATDSAFLLSVSIIVFSSSYRAGVPTRYARAGPVRSCALTPRKTTSLFFTAHARDLYQVPGRALIERVEKATAVVTCCASNLDYLNKLLRAAAAYAAGGMRALADLSARHDPGAIKLIGQMR